MLTKWTFAFLFFIKAKTMLTKCGLFNQSQNRLGDKKFEERLGDKKFEVNNHEHVNKMDFCFFIKAKTMLTKCGLF